MIYEPEKLVEVPALLIFVDIRNFTSMMDCSDNEKIVAQFVMNFYAIADDVFFLPIFDTTPKTTAALYRNDEKPEILLQEGQLQILPRIAKRMGDGFLFVFFIGEERWAEALQLFLERIANFEKKFDDLKKRDILTSGKYEERIHLGWGVTAGNVIVLPAEEVGWQCDAIGKAINRASRLCDCARPNGVVIDANVFPNKPESTFFGDWQRHQTQLKGIKGKTGIWQAK